MESISKYKFENILVANTELLMNMSINGNGSQPKILVLNSKLDKCENKNRQSSQVKCSSCCLQLERPAFRRRIGGGSDSYGPNSGSNPAECFANCSDRRPIDIELNAQTELRGKLVVLALTRTGTRFPPDSGQCQTTKSWSFVRFEPESNSNINHLYYSRIDPQSVPSLKFSSAELSWNPNEARESISLQIQTPSQPLKRRQQVLHKETLIINELTCQEPHKTVHLIALINRNSTKTDRANPAKSLTDSLATRKPSNIAKSEATPSEVSSVELAPESYIDYPQAAQSQRKRAISKESPASSISGATIPKIETRLAANNSLATGSHISPRNDDLEYPTIGLNHFKSSGILLVSVFSSLIIFTYTLCLLMYLKSRPKPQAKAKNRVLSSRQPHGEAADGKHEIASCISEPFNLQMAPATRTRLVIMLGRRNRRPRRTKSRTHFGDRPHHKGLSLDSSSHRAQSHNLNFSRSNKAVRVSTSRQLSSGDELQTFGQHRVQISQYPIATGTIRMVRALRHAALSKFRTKDSRLTSFLNAIPESELEHFQVTDNGSDLIDQLDSSIREAMSSNCSHLAEKSSHRRQQVVVATLFAKPTQIPGGDSYASASQPGVSRSKILKRVRSDDIYEEHDPRIQEQTDEKQAEDSEKSMIEHKL